MKLSADNSRRARKLRALIERLPVRERPLWRKRLQLRLAQQPALVVRGDAGTATPETQREWDLELANWLDRSYGIVSDRVEVVSRKMADAASAAGFSLWPLAVVAVAMAWAYSTSKRSSYGG